MTTAPRKKRMWSVRDFARHAYGEDDEAACRRARRFLVKLNAKSGGDLLMPTSGSNRGFTLIVAKIWKLMPDLFQPIDSLEFRIEALEEQQEEAKANERCIVAQVKQNSRDIAAMRMRRANGAGRIGHA